MFTKNFQTESEACAYLASLGYEYKMLVIDGAAHIPCWHRVHAGINQRAFVGRCLTGQWIVTGA